MTLMPWSRANRHLINRLGESVTIAPPGGEEAWSGRGVYRPNRQESENVPVVGRPDPELDVVDDESVPVDPGSIATLEESGRTFRLISAEPDGFGLLTLYLREEH